VFGALLLLWRAVLLLLMEKGEIGDQMSQAVMELKLGMQMAENNFNSMRLKEVTMFSSFKFHTLYLTYTLSIDLSAPLSRFLF